MPFFIVFSVAKFFTAWQKVTFHEHKNHVSLSNRQAFYK